MDAILINAIINCYTQLPNIDNYQYHERVKMVHCPIKIQPNTEDIVKPVSMLFEKYPLPGGKSEWRFISLC